MTGQRIYLKLYVDFDDDEKVVRLARYGKDARGLRDLLVGMWRYAKARKSDGNVPLEQIGKLVYPDTLKNGIRDADRLVDVGLAERTDDGYYLPGFLKHNPSAAQIADLSAKRAASGQTGGTRSGMVRRGEATPNQLASRMLQHGEPRVQRTENKEQRTDPLGTRGGERNGSAPASEPPTPHNPYVCERHQPDGTTDACTACRVRRLTQEAKDRADAKTSRARADAIAACPDCQGTGWLINPDTDTTTRCTHPQVAP